MVDETQKNSGDLDQATTNY